MAVGVRQVVRSGWWRVFGRRNELRIWLAFILANVVTWFVAFLETFVWDQFGWLRLLAWCVYLLLLVADLLHALVYGVGHGVWALLKSLACSCLRICLALVHSVVCGFMQAQYAPLEQVSESERLGHLLASACAGLT